MPTYRPTNAGLQTKGTLWAGFDPTTSGIVAGVFMVSVMATFAAISVLKFSWLFAVPVLFVLPNVALLSVVVLLVMGKPPGYLRDWFESRILERKETGLNWAEELPPLDL
jgi:hypothetical protein